MPTVIEVDHVTKEFRLGQLSGAGQSLRNAWLRLRGERVEERPPFKALDDVSFKVEQGEVLGIIGHNGAGKSTLLKTLAGISQPTRGAVRVSGRIAPLIEVGAGVVPDMTGRENVFLNASILGMRRAEIKRKFDEIVAFAEMEQFIDTPMKRYSSGMQVRLGFAIATAIEAEVLIVDEVLAVGDLAFQRKCYDRIEEIIRRRGSTVLIVSHIIRQIERLCSRVIMLDHGRLIASGSPKQICDQFVDRNNEKIAAVRTNSSARLTSTPEFELHSLTLHRTDGSNAESVTVGENLTIRVDFELKRNVSHALFSVAIHTTDLFFIATSASEAQHQIDELEPGRYILDVTVRKPLLAPGTYGIHFGVEAGISSARLFLGDSLANFHVRMPRDSTISGTERLGVVLFDFEWDQPVHKIKRLIQEPIASL